MYVDFDHVDFDHVSRHVSCTYHVSYFDHVSRRHASCTYPPPAVLRGRASTVAGDDGDAATRSCARRGRRGIAFGPVITASRGTLGASCSQCGWGLGVVDHGWVCTTKAISSWYVRQKRSRSCQTNIDFNLESQKRSRSVFYVCTCAITQTE